MRFENFDLKSPHGAVELQGLGHDWDLHNWPDFHGFEFDPAADELTMEWTVPAEQANPWGSRGNTARGCRLRFCTLRYFRSTGRDPAYPIEESRTVSELSKAVPEPGEYRYQQVWGPEEPFHLIIRFQDEREFEISADVVRLEAMP